jgi:hypothetical protein
MSTVNARVMPGLVVTASLLTSAAAMGAEVSRVEVIHQDNVYTLSLEAYLEAPPAAVFSVITDYPHIQDLHRRVRESRVLRRIDARTTEVYTLVRGCVAAIFCKSLRRVERVTEIPPTELTAEIIPEDSDLKSGTVHWRLLAEGMGTRLQYDSAMEPDFWVPPLLGTGLMSLSFRNTTEDMIARVEALARDRSVGGGQPWLGAP